MSSSIARGEEEIRRLLQLATRMARRWGVTGADADDLAQEAVIRFLRTDPPPLNEGAWLFVVVRRMAHRQGQRETARSHAEAHYEKARHPVAGGLDLSLDMVSVLDRLNERDRRLIELVIHGASARDIADRFGCHVRDVGQMVARVRRRARRLYESN